MSLLWKDNTGVGIMSLKERGWEILTVNMLRVQVLLKTEIIPENSRQLYS